MKAVTKGQEMALACGLVVSLATGNGFVFGLVGLAIMYTWLVSPVCRPQLRQLGLSSSAEAELRARYGEVPKPRSGKRSPDEEKPSDLQRRFAIAHEVDCICRVCDGGFD